MIIGSLAFFLYYWISFKTRIFNNDRMMEESPVLLNKPFTIKTMPFATERIVY